MRSTRIEGDNECTDQKCIIGTVMFETDFHPVCTQLASVSHWTSSCIIWRRVRDETKIREKSLEKILYFHGGLSAECGSEIFRFPRPRTRIYMWKQLVLRRLRGIISPPGNSPEILNINQHSYLAVTDRLNLESKIMFSRSPVDAISNHCVYTAVYSRNIAHLGRS